MASPGWMSRIRAIAAAIAAANAAPSSATLAQTLVACIAGLLLTLQPAHATEALPLAADPALEARVMQISEELRCLVCQNETIAASQAALAIDLRKQIATQLKAGRSPDQIRDYMVDRYGEFVLYRPVFNARTALLWLGPFVLLLAGLAFLRTTIRRRRSEAAGDDMSDADRRRVRALLEGDAG